MLYILYCNVMYNFELPVAASDVEVCDSDLVWYALLRAVDAFHTEFRCYPGHLPQHVETDIGRLKVRNTTYRSIWRRTSAG